MAENTINMNMLILVTLFCWFLTYRLHTLVKTSSLTALKVCVKITVTTSMHQVSPK